jgi:hypothetical protein
MLKDRRAVFLGLDHEEEYFPMLARTDSQAFFALPPEAISPRAPKLAPLDRVPAQNPTSHLNYDYGHDVHDGGLASFYDSSDEDESDMGSDEPLDDVSERASIHARVSRTLWPRTDHPACSPTVQSHRNRVTSPVRNFYLLLHCSTLTNSGNRATVAPNLSTSSYVG